MKIIDGAKLSYPAEYPVGENVYLAEKHALSYAKIINWYIRQDKTERKNITFWCTGSSGSILSALTAKIYREKYSDVKITINHIRKDGESSHHSNIEYKHDKRTYNFLIDDFICTGKTVIRIIENVSNILDRQRSINLSKYYKLTLNKNDNLKMFDILLVKLVSNLIFKEEFELIRENFKYVLETECSPTKDAKEITCNGKTYEIVKPFCKNNIKSLLLWMKKKILIL